MSLRVEQLPRRSSNIFINYRREDSAGHAGRLFDRLSGRFPDRVFMDVDTIKPGIDFVDTIEQAVGCCEVLIVVIGREWLYLTNSAGRRRLDDPNDFVRLEIAAALERNIRIIPVLVEGAPMPRLEDLPPDLARLTRRNAIELSDVRWSFDVDRLLQAIEGVLQEKAPSALLPTVKVPAMPAPSTPAPSTPARVRRKARPLSWLAVPVLALLSLAGWNGAGQPSLQKIQEELISWLGHTVPMTPQEVTHTEVAREKTTRPSKKVASPQHEQREPGFKKSQGGFKAFVEKRKSEWKNFRDRRRAASEKKDDQQKDSEKQSG